MSRYNINARQAESGNILTVDCEFVDKTNELFIVMRYKNQSGKVIRIETETIRKG